MLKRQSLLAVTLFAVSACASEAGGEPAPTACKRTDRSGTYLQTFETRAGTCGDMDDQLVNFDAPAGPAGGGGCTVTHENWSENDCKLERTVACTGPDGASTLTGVTRQQTANGSTVSGTFTVSVRLDNGSVCSGTYAVTAVRQ